jgi:hypothetical protein
MREFKVATSYGGFLGKLVRRLGYDWNHILLVMWGDGEPVYTYESNIRGIQGHPFQEGPDLAEEHAWWVPREPLTALEFERLLGYCQGAEGKWYALHYWLTIVWRILKDLLLGPTRWQKLSLIPAETCISFVDAACRSVGRPISPFGAEGLPDDIARSPWWKGEDRV